MLPASLMTRWNSLFLHTLTHGQGWVGGVGMMTFLSLAHMWHATHLTFLALAHMWHATQVMGRVGWVGWGWWRTHFYALDVSSLAHMWHATHLTFLALAHMWHAMLLGNQSLNVALWNLHRWVGWVGQFTKWHSKTRLTGTQALDKVWSHLKKHVPKSLCSRSKSDRRFNPRMEQYVYSYMWRFNNRNWWKQLGQLCQQHWQKENTSANEVFFFFSVLPTSQSKIAKIELRTQFWRVFYTSVKIQNRKKRGN